MTLLRNVGSGQSWCIHRCKYNLQVEILYLAVQQHAVCSCDDGFFLSVYIRFCPTPAALAVGDAFIP